LRKHVGKGAIIGGRAGELVGFADVRRRIDEDACAYGAGVAHINHRQREILGVGHHDLVVVPDSPGGPSNQGDRGARVVRIGRPGSRSRGFTTYLKIA
jgi:hypothetical protein